MAYDVKTYSVENCDLYNGIDLELTPENFEDFAPRNSYAVLVHRILIKDLDLNGGVLTVQLGVQLTPTGSPYTWPLETITYEYDQMAFGLSPVLVLDSDKLLLYIKSNNASDTNCDVTIQQANIVYTNLGAIDSSANSAEALRVAFG